MTPPKRPMHIVFLCSEYPPFSHGGIGSFVYTAATSLVKQGVKTSVVGIYRDIPFQKEINEGVTIFRIPSKRIPKIGFILDNLNLLRLIKQIDRENPIDVIEGQEASFAFLPRNSSWKKIIRMHGGHHFFYTELGKKPRPWRSWLEKRSFAKADFFCAVSNYVANRTRQLLKLGNKSITIIPNSIDTQLFSPKDISEEPGMIVFVGTIAEKKGVRQLIEAFPMVLNNDAAARLYLIGRDTFDIKTHKSFFQELVKNLSKNVCESIHFIGPIPTQEVPSWLARAQVCIFPSHMEAQGIVIIEAMSCGKAVIASKTGPGPEIIDDGINGLLCDPFSPLSIAEKINTLLTDNNLRNTLGVNARNRVVVDFSSDLLVIKNIEFYKECIR